MGEEEEAEPITALDDEIGWSDRVDLLAVVLMSLTAILTAWTGFESAKWSGVQAIAFSDAAAARTESVRASNTAGQLFTVDVALFTEFVDATARDDDELATFYRDRFPDRLAVATDAWLDLNPLEDPDAPPSPFALPEYELVEAEEADRLEQEAGEHSAAAREANQQSDDYVLTTVMFAAVLFFTALSGRLRNAKASAVTLIIGAIGFVVGAGIVATFPVEI